jgi:hypothetical protein
MEILKFILLALISFLISSTVHELGHIFAGLREGFRFHLLVVGPFGLKRNEDDRVVPFLEKDVSFWGGIGATLPATEDPENFRRFGRVLLGGPLLSILLGAAVLPIGIMQDSMFLTLLGAMPISMGIACLIPARNGAFYTDGGRWVRMHGEEKTRIVETAIWTLTQTAIVRGSYASLDETMIGVLKADEDFRTRYLGHHYAFCRYRDRGEGNFMDLEAEAMEKLKDKVPRQMVSLFGVENARVEKVDGREVEK